MTSCGLLLGTICIMHLTDRCSLYTTKCSHQWQYTSDHPKEGVFYVHIFALTFPDAERLHGTAMAAERFCGPISEQPDVWLVQWHYN
jgi:hypothetical protein